MIDCFLLCNFMIAQIFKLLFFISLLLVEIMFFNIDANYASRAVIGALIGGLVLTYFDANKPNHKAFTWFDAVIKTLLSSLSSLFIAPAFIKYFAILDLDYVGLFYFVFSIIALIILKALHSLTEQNAKEIIINVFTRVLNIETKTEQRDRFKTKLEK